MGFPYISLTGSLKRGDYIHFKHWKILVEVAKYSIYWVVVSNMFYFHPYMGNDPIWLIFLWHSGFQATRFDTRGRTCPCDLCYCEPGLRCELPESVGALFRFPWVSWQTWHMFFFGPSSSLLMDLFWFWCIIRFPWWRASVELRHRKHQLPEFPSPLEMLGRWFTVPPRNQTYCCKHWST